MLTNYHTHTTFSDGKNTLEEVVLSAIEKGLSAIGFSAHGNTPYDLQYCMRDTLGYIAEINALKVKYGRFIQIYLGVEEDCFAPVDKSAFDYNIGSCHYIRVNGKYYPLDLSYDYFQKVLSLFESPIQLAERYYEDFCDYIQKRNPDVIGHFDLITKYEEKGNPLFFHDEKYWEKAEKALLKALRSGSFFEINTGAITRGYRTVPYPHERLLYIIKKEGGKFVLSSDAHQKDTLTSYFDEAKALLKDVGIKETYHLYDGTWKKENI